MEKYPVYILAGGRSSRFGSDKARALLAGEPLIAWLARQAEPAAAAIAVVADRPDKYADLGLRTIADVHPGLGPLAGLHAALLDARDRAASADDAILILSCDMTAFAPSWAELLAAALRSATGVSVFADVQGRHPFPGLYRPRLADLAAEYLRSGRAAVRGFIEAAGCAEQPLPGDWPAIAQVNTADDLRRAGG